MKVYELLTEVKIGPNLGGATEGKEYWVIFSRDTIKTFPHYSFAPTFNQSLTAYFNNGKLAWDFPKDLSKEEYKVANEKSVAAHKKATEFLNQDYKNNKFGVCLVNNSEHTIDFDMTKYSGNESRRPNSKIANFNHDSRDAYPVLQGDAGFARTLDIIKVLKALVKRDPKVKDYTPIGDDRLPEDATISEIISGTAKVETHDKIYDVKTESITFYHGTSAKRVKSILKTGLQAGERGSIYSDMIQGYSDKNVYLSLSPFTASNYATREAINDGSDPVVLAITLKTMQLQKLKADEDTMHWLWDSVSEPYIRRLFKRNPILTDIWGSEKGGLNIHIDHLHHDTKTMGMKWLRDNANDEMQKKAKAAFAKYGINNDAKIEALEKHLYLELMKTYVEGSFDRTVKDEGNMAYPGNIPASQIKLLKTWSIKGTKISKDGSKPGEYNAAIDKQKTTLKKTLK